MADGVSRKIGFKVDQNVIWTDRDGIERGGRIIRIHRKVFQVSVGLWADGLRRAFSGTACVSPDSLRAESANDDPASPPADIDAAFSIIRKDTEARVYAEDAVLS